MPASRTIDSPSLERLLAGEPPPVLLDVRPAEHHEIRHLPGSRNACVYPVSFLADVASLGLAKTDRLVVYGSGESSLASRDAARKLERAGYSRVYDFRGGLEEWGNRGLPTEGKGETPSASPPPESEHLVVDTAKSRLRWVGRNLAGRHEGEIAIREGEVRLSRGRLAGGRVVLDMRRITCADLEDAGLNRLLIDHFESDDFFDVERHPEAVFEIAEARADSGAPPGSPDHQVAGTLLLKGVTGDLSFPLTSGRTTDGEWAAQANFDLDRTRWGVNYGSGRLYDLLGMHLVNDRISLEFVLVAR
jgi:rhodanese-related sulfurtransferase/polyisoprenoid-binding protein YceI